MVPACRLVSIMKISVVVLMIIVVINIAVINIIVARAVTIGGTTTNVVIAVVSPSPCTS